jgi:hypothetical protein
MRKAIVAVAVARAVPECLKFWTVKDILSGTVPSAVNLAVAGIMKATPGGGIVLSVVGKWWSSWGSIVKAIVTTSLAETVLSVMNANNT